MKSAWKEGEGAEWPLRGVSRVEGEQWAEGVTNGEEEQQQ
jgi:hypothetical protein